MPTIIVKTRTSEKGYSLNAPSVFVGRGPKCSLQIDEEGIAVMHCKIAKEGNTFKVYDLSSPTGTFLNGTRITEKSLKHLDSIQIGHATITFYVTDEKVMTRRSVPQQTVNNSAPNSQTTRQTSINKQSLNSKTPVPISSQNTVPTRVTTARKLPSGPVTQNSQNINQNNNVYSTNNTQGIKKVTGRIPTGQTNRYTVPAQTGGTGNTRKITSARVQVPTPVPQSPPITAKRRTTSRSYIDKFNQNTVYRKKKGAFFYIFILLVLGLAGFGGFVLYKNFLEGEDPKVTKDKIKDTVKDLTEGPSYQKKRSKLVELARDGKAAELEKEIADYMQVRQYDKAIKLLEETHKKLISSDKGRQYASEIKSLLIDKENEKKNEEKKAKDFKDLVKSYKSWKEVLAKPTGPALNMMQIQLNAAWELRKNEKYEDWYYDCLSAIGKEIETKVKEISKTLVTYKDAYDKADIHFQDGNFRLAIAELDKVNYSEDEKTKAQETKTKWTGFAKTKVIEMKDDKYKKITDENKAELKRDFDKEAAKLRGINEEINNILNEIAKRFK